MYNSYYKHMGRKELINRGYLYCKLFKYRDKVKYETFRFSLRSGDSDVEGAHKLASMISK
jgi:predicted O-linked N-acetylglucosamine transferase (SPINDLY family)